MGMGVRGDSSVVRGPGPAARFLAPLPLAPLLRCMLRSSGPLQLDTPQTDSRPAPPAPHNNPITPTKLPAPVCPAGQLLAQAPTRDLPGYNLTLGMGFVNM